MSEQCVCVGTGSAHSFALGTIGLSLFLRGGVHVHFLKFCSGSFLGSLVPVMQETWVQSLGWEDTLEKGMATHSSILAWRIPWTDEPGGLQLSMGSRRVRHNLSN